MVELGAKAVAAIDARNPIESRAVTKLQSDSDFRRDAARPSLQLA